MNSPLGVIEYSTYSDSRREGYLDCPSFEDDVWPWLRLQWAEFREVLMRPRCGHLRRRFKLDRNEELVPLSQDDKLSKADFDTIATAVSFGCDLDIFFAIAVGNPLHTFIRKWPKPPRPRVVDEVFREEGIRAAVVNALNRYGPGVVLLGFAHDGDPLVVIGRPEDLGRLHA
jgi:hypothetical protein